jgi:hypothetical protein
MDAFGIVFIVLALIAVVVAVVSYWGSGRAYGEIGGGGLSMEHDPERTPPPSAGSAEAREEIRQMLEAKSERQVARGGPPLDVEAELETLTRSSPGTDPGLRDEVRQVVMAGNERRARQGKPPLDVEAETDRRLRDLGG